MICLKKVGVIAEYNPFHNGHLYHLNKVKEMFPDSFLILVLIGNFTQRGEISVINKWDKTKIALNYGYDLVVELPFLFATQSASFYAKGAVEILDKLDCDYLVFGSELNDVKTLEDLVNTTYENKDYESLVKKYVDNGNNYPLSCSLALKDLTGKLIDKPNDVLALEYVRCIKLLNSKIKPISIKRTNDYHEEDINKEITSATSIRRNIKNINKIKNTMPRNSISFINDINYDKYFDLILGSELDGTRSKKSEVILEVLNKLNAIPNESIMIGDRMHDIIGAKEAGIKSIGVTFGYAEDGELEESGADFIVESSSELLSCIFKLI